MSKRQQQAAREHAARRQAQTSKGPRRSGLVIGGLVVLGIVVALGAFLLLRGGDEASAAYDDLVSAGTCTESSYEDVGRNDHTQDLAERVLDYKSDPPTAGSHYVQPALWGLYDAPVQVEQLVHNLEHGGIVVYYGPDVPQEQVDALIADVKDDRDFMIVTPYPKGKGEVITTAWTHMIRCEGYQPEARQVAIDRWRGKGPEATDAMALRQPNW